MNNHISKTTVGIESNRKKPNFAEWSFWLQWVIATMLGGLPVMVAIWGGPSRITVIGAGIIVGFFTGLMQWFVLRQWVYRASWWILVSGIAGVLSLIIAFIGSFIFSLFQILGLGIVGSVTAGAIIGSFSGATLGIMQWFILRRWVNQAGWWIVTRALVGAIITIGKLLTLVTIGKSSVLAEIGTGMITGIITGMVLVWLFQHIPQR